MPYMNITLSKKLTDQQKDLLKAKLGEYITIIPGKTEKVLMVHIQDDATLYFSGQKSDHIAFINVKLFKKANLDDKKAFTKKIFELFEQSFQIPPDHLFMNFDEYENWAFNGNLNG